MICCIFWQFFNDLFLDGIHRRDFGDGSVKRKVDKVETKQMSTKFLDGNLCQICHTVSNWCSLHYLDKSAHYFVSTPNETILALNWSIKWVYFRAKRNCSINIDWNNLDLVLISHPLNELFWNKNDMFT